VSALRALLFGLVLAVGLGGPALPGRVAVAAPAEASRRGPPIIDLPETPAQLALEAGWAAEELPALTASADAIGPARLVAMYREEPAARPQRGDPALALVVLRFDAPNPRAWRDATRGAYVAEIEASLLAACAPDAGSSCRGFKVQKRATFESELVPGLELSGKDAGGATRLVRILFFRTYAIVAAVEVPARSSSRALARARTALRSFTVMPNWQR
jgi:hypothetical protein